MLQDIQLTGFDFPKQTILPTTTSDHFHLFYIFSGSGFLIVDSSSFSCGKNNPGALAVTSRLLQE